MIIIDDLSPVIDELTNVELRASDKCGGSGYAGTHSLVSIMCPW